jgi:hypothetical protein
MQKVYVIKMFKDGRTERVFPFPVMRVIAELTIQQLNAGFPGEDFSYQIEEEKG